MKEFAPYQLPKVGDRIRMSGPMKDDPDPIPMGSEGTVTLANSYNICVKWDNDRSLSLVPGDPFQIISKSSS